MKKTTVNECFVFSNPLTVLAFSKKVNVDAGGIIKYFFIKGTAVSLNTVLKKEDCQELCGQFNIDFMEKDSSDENENIFLSYLSFSDTDDLVLKTPIVTIMGHVDHGKTTLLDKIRGTNVTDTEFGGITQHIGAYQIHKGDKKITFLDTPGHQAFTKMRARGANVTDIVVLVVAADDGIKPQTIEAIQHALAAKVKIVVFINKIDKGTKNIDSLKNALMNHGIVLEEFGGDVLCVQGSALKGIGIDDLLETISLLAEVSEFKTTLVNPAIGTIIESNLDKGLGATATVLLSRGTLKCGDFIVTKSSICKIKLMMDAFGKMLNHLEPCCPAKISGFKSLPEVGDKFISFDNEKEAKKFFESCSEDLVKQEIFLEQTEDTKNLSILLKADVSGSLEAIKEIIYNNNIAIIASSLGPVLEADLQLASLSNSLVINFNQKISQGILNRAKDMKVSIRNYRSVYEIEEEILDLIEKNKFVEKVEESLGKAEVLKLWSHSKVGTIAGCKVIEGKISKTDKVRVIRGDEILCTSTIKSFKTEDYEIKECLQNQECGIVVNNWNNIKVGDIIEAFRIV